MRDFFKYLYNSNKHKHHLVSFFEDLYSDQIRREKEELKESTEINLVKEMNEHYIRVSSKILSLMPVDNYKNLRKLMARDVMGKKLVVGESKLKAPCFTTYEAVKEKAGFSEEYSSPEEFGRLLFQGKQVRVQTQFAEIIFKDNDFEIKIVTLEEEKEKQNKFREQKQKIRQEGLGEEDVCKPGYTAFKSLLCLLIKRLYRLYKEGKTKLDTFTVDSVFVLLFSSWPSMAVRLTRQVSASVYRSCCPSASRELQKQVHCKAGATPRVEGLHART